MGTRRRQCHHTAAKQQCHHGWPKQASGFQTGVFLVDMQKGCCSRDSLAGPLHRLEKVLSRIILARENTVWKVVRTTRCRIIGNWIRRACTLRPGWSRCVMSSGTNVNATDTQASNEQEPDEESEDSSGFDTSYGEAEDIGCELAWTGVTSQTEWSNTLSRTAPHHLGKHLVAPGADIVICNKFPVRFSESMCFVPLCHTCAQVAERGGRARQAWTQHQRVHACEVEQPADSVFEKR